MIVFLSLYLMSSSMVMMNMKTKKTPAPPRKCQMSCLRKQFDEIMSNNEECTLFGHCKFRGGVLRSHFSLLRKLYFFGGKWEGWESSPNKQCLNYILCEDTLSLTHRRSPTKCRPGLPRGTLLATRWSSSPCSQRTTLRVWNTGLQELERRLVIQIKSLYSAF